MDFLLAKNCLDVGCLVHSGRHFSRSLHEGQCRTFLQCFYQVSVMLLKLSNAAYSLVHNGRHGELVNRPNFSLKPGDNGRQGELLTQGPGWFGFYRAPKRKLCEQNVPQLNKILSQSLKKTFTTKPIKVTCLLLIICFKPSIPTSA